MNQKPLPIEWVERIFMRLHGRFGNTFFDKYRIGQLNDNGDDIGVENAKQVWAEELAGMTVERIAEALKCSYEYAPSCDDFKANCVIRAQVQDYKAIEKKIDYEAGKEFASNVVDFIEKKKTTQKDYKQWARDILANPSIYPDYSVKCAREALSA